jgi:adenylate cyclase
VSDAPLTVEDVLRCFTGVIPLVLATTSGRGEPNVTYVSRALPLGEGRIAISNQFLSKTHRNLAEHPQASLLLTDPTSLAEFRATISFEQTLRRGPVFDRLRRDLSMIAALTGMRDVFRLAGADVFRVERIDRVAVNRRTPQAPPPIERMFTGDHAALGQLCGRLSRCSDLGSLVGVLVAGLDELLGYDHSMVLLADEDGRRLFTIASHGYADEGVGSEIAIGDGVAGQAAALCAPVRLDPVPQLAKYARSVRESYTADGQAGTDVPLPGLARPGSQLAVPAITLGELIGVLLVESEANERFRQIDEAVLSILASLVAGMIQALRRDVAQVGGAGTESAPPPATDAGSPIAVRHYTVDGSTFVGGDYLIKGVAGKLLWSLLQHHQRNGRTEFTNREVRLDLAGELPDFRDNFESRLILLKRRLDERAAPMRLHKTGRGRFRLEVIAPLVLDEATSR